MNIHIKVQGKENRLSLQTTYLIIMTSNLCPPPLKCCGTFEDILFESFSFFVAPLPLLALCAGPITHLYHYLHYALWGISYNLAQATLSVLCHSVTNCLPCWTQVSTRVNKEAWDLLVMNLMGDGPWLEDVSGCSPLSGILCFLPGHESPRYANGHDKCPNWTA